MASANLQHIHAFGTTGAGAEDVIRDTAELRWLTLLDGMPLVAWARRVTGHGWPRLAGSDLLLPILAAAAESDVTVGFLGGESDMHECLAARLRKQFSSLDVAGYWAPPRSVVDDLEQSDDLAGEVARAGVDLLVVGLGKPRQERWIQTHAARTGSRVLLAFGAAANFLAGVEQRAPQQVSAHGLEWAYRLGREPRRLGRRYLVQGPPAALRLARASSTRVEASPHAPTRKVRSVAAVVVTYNNERDIVRLLDSIPGAASGLDVTTVVVDNGSTDGTARLACRPDVTLISAGRNLGYAGGINLAHQAVGAETDALAILNPDLLLRPGALSRLAESLSESDVGVCVPKILNPDGSVFRSLHHGPTVLGEFGEAAFGDHWSHRPGVLGDTIRDDGQYERCHVVGWASGACWMIAAECDLAVGPWDESFFLYSEEVDYARRVRQMGFAIEYVPSAVVEHAGGGSGSSAELYALMAVNRVRDYERHHGPTTSLAFRAAVAARHLARSSRAQDRQAFTTIARRSSWALLPKAQACSAEGSP
ncbi:WecB/TagA/CpsF family glycosyltransferase [Terrabacter sp. LjRoot27]|uniref:WecB/TagA/CpsF family glycosyltransferase n=1 Tax=Terrabacter sp. LjRoot27 TaxID=3342306 RepID=UPI003ED08850